MPDEPWRGEAQQPAAARQDSTRGDGHGPTPNRPPGQQFPGWRVTRPNGSGKQPANRPPTRSRWLVILLVLGLLVVNFVISYEAQRPAARVQVPYSPTFLSQVKADNVSEISSTGDSIVGTFRKAVKYPSNSSISRRPFLNVFKGIAEAKYILFFLLLCLLIGRLTFQLIFLVTHIFNNFARLCDIFLRFCVSIGLDTSGK